MKSIKGAIIFASLIWVGIAGNMALAAPACEQTAIVRADSVGDYNLDNAIARHRDPATTVKLHAGQHVCVEGRLFHWYLTRVRLPNDTMEIYVQDEFLAFSE